MTERKASGRSGGGGSDQPEPRARDRRRFDPQTGERRDAGTGPGDEIPLPGGGVLRPAEEEGAGLPVGFGDLVRPFLLMGLAGLGILPHPETGATRVELGTARAAIEILRLLRDRTEGHRTEEEERLLTEALFELEMQFVEVRKRREP